jgi:hypothetical protein
MKIIIEESDVGKEISLGSWVESLTQFANISNVKFDDLPLKMEDLDKLTEFHLKSHRDWKHNKHPYFGTTPSREEVSVVDETKRRKKRRKSKLKPLRHWDKRTKKTVEAIDKELA